MSPNLVAARSALKLGFLVSSLIAASMGATLSARLATEGAAGFAPHDHPLRPLAPLARLNGAEPVRLPTVRATAPETIAAIPILPAKPFVFHGGAADRRAAVTCLTQAVYYEAGFEPIGGAQAVAQVVLNRVRHPIFPKSICGVVYQGAQLKTGCQFSFTCDGSLAKTPAKGAWDRAQAVAERALGGFVQKDVGEATHYHTQFVSPWWKPTVTRIAQVGVQIFYRWPGALGAPAAFTGHYAGGEHVGRGAITPPGLTQAAAAGADGRVHVILAAASSGAPASPGPASLRSASLRSSSVMSKAEALSAMTLASGGGSAAPGGVADPAAPVDDESAAKR